MLSSVVKPILLFSIFFISCHSNDQNKKFEESLKKGEEIFGHPEDLRTAENESSNEYMKEAEALDPVGTWICSSCMFSIVIFHDEDGYRYAFNDTQHYEINPLTISRENSGTYLNFENIHWYDHPGLEESSLAEVSVLLEGNTFTIQNYGNAMNEYMIFEGHGKYLTFEKEALD